MENVLFEADFIDGDRIWHGLNYLERSNGFQQELWAQLEAQRRSWREVFKCIIDKYVLARSECWGDGKRLVKISLVTRLRVFQWSIGTGWNRAIFAKSALELSKAHPVSTNRSVSTMMGPIRQSLACDETTQDWIVSFPLNYILVSCIFTSVAEQTYPSRYDVWPHNGRGRRQSSLRTVAPDYSSRDDRPFPKHFWLISIQRPLWISERRAGAPYHSIEWLGHYTGRLSGQQRRIPRNCHLL